MRAIWSILSLGLISAWYCAAALAADGWNPTFGPEFTFTNNELIESAMYNRATQEYDRARNAMLDEIQRRCPECRIELVTEGRYAGSSKMVTFPDGFWFQVSFDPAVIEVQMKPCTVEQLHENLERIRTMIFETAAVARIEPHTHIGGGHIHIGLLETFGNDARLFRNFIVDIANHPELALGALGSTKTNAKPVVVQKREIVDAFEAVVAEFDRLPQAQQTIEWLAGEILNRVDRLAAWDIAWAPRYKSLNLTRVLWLIERTIEFRAGRPQTSPEKFILLAELFRGRIAYLRSQQGILVFNRTPVQVQGVDWHNNLPRVPRLTAEGKADFHLYVTEAGMDYDRFKELLADADQFGAPAHEGRRPAVWRCQGHMGSGTRRLH